MPGEKYRRLDAAGPRRCGDGVGIGRSGDDRNGTGVRPDFLGDSGGGLVAVGPRDAAYRAGGDACRRGRFRCGGLADRAGSAEYDDLGRRERGERVARGGREPAGGGQKQGGVELGGERRGRESVGPGGAGRQEYRLGA